MTNAITFEEMVQMDIDYAQSMLDEAADNYKADPCDDTWEMLTMWQDIVDDLFEELER